MVWIEAPAFCESSRTSNSPRLSWPRPSSTLHRRATPRGGMHRRPNAAV